MQAHHHEQHEQSYAAAMPPPQRWRMHAAMAEMAREDTLHELEVPRLTHTPYARHALRHRMPTAWPPHGHRMTIA